MKTFLRIILVLSFVSAVYAADDVVTAVHGTIEKVDSGTKTIVVKTDDGIHHSFHVVDATAVHGADASEEAAKDSWHGIAEGTEVAAHNSRIGGRVPQLGFSCTPGLEEAFRSQGSSLQHFKPSTLV